MTDRYTKAAEALVAECIVQDFDAEAAASLLRAEFTEHDAAVAELAGAVNGVITCKFRGCDDCKDNLQAALAALEGR